MKHFFAVVLIVLFSFSVAFAALGPVKPEEAVKSAFPGLKVDSIYPSEIDGIYEVVSGQNVLYFVKEKNFIIAGEIFSSNGRNLTQERKQSLMAVKLKDLPLDKAVKVGNGKAVVIEFTDPDCPYCRKASKALKGRTDLTRYIFLTPIAHPNALPKVHHILNSEDKAKALEDMMEGKDVPRAASDYPENIKKLASEHIQWGKTVGVSGTPTFFVNGQAVIGADMEKLDALVKKSNEMMK